MNKPRKYIALVLHIIYLNNIKFGECIPINNFDAGNSNNILPPETTPSDVCFISKISQTGTIKFIEECESLEHLEGKPLQLFQSFLGSNVKICCPEKPAAQNTCAPPCITFPSTDMYDQSYADQYSQYDYYEYANKESSRIKDDSADENYEYATYEYDDYDAGPPGVLAVTTTFCDKDANEECLDLGECSNQDFVGDRPPGMCGWNKESGDDKFCCKAIFPRNTQKVATAVEKKYGDYECEDYHSVCETFVHTTPESCTANHTAYPFMRIACMKSCGRCKDKGCRDEFEQCERWKQKGHCVRFPKFMQFNCRESCGACGLTSPRNVGSQIKGNKDYSNIDNPKFFCGQSKPRSEISVAISYNRYNQRGKRDVSQLQKRQITNEGDAQIWYSTDSEEDTNRGINCGSTIINDKFIVFAAHCAIKFTTTDNAEDEIKTTIIRDGTIHQDEIEIRRIFKHPNFKFPSLYDDIAVAELGRRMVYDFDIYGDSPSCLGSLKNSVEGRRGIIQGYGYTEQGLRGDLAEANVTIINNQDCAKYLEGNTTNEKSIRTKLRQALEDGINIGLTCSTGDFGEETELYSGPCQGDSGGPLYVNYDKGNRKQQTLEGIICGGLGCGKNIPSWYTRVASYRNWINCIMEEVMKGNTQETVESICTNGGFTQKFRPNNKIKR